VRDPSETNTELIEENALLMQRIQDLEQAGSDRKWAEDKLISSEKRLRDLNELQGLLLKPNSIEQKLKLVTEVAVQIVGADFARVWMIKPGDRCQAGCIHAQIAEGPHICRFRDQCLHLIASSGRYTHIDGRDHGRVPFGCYKIGKIAAGAESKFLITEVTNDPRVHNHMWAKELDLMSFAGYRLADSNGAPNGVLALFSKQAITAEEDSLLQGIADATSQVLKSARVEEALRESEERFRSLFDRSIDCLYIHNFKGQFIDGNPSALRLLGYNKEELPSLNFATLIDDDQIPKALEVLAEIKQTGFQKELSEFRVRRKDGSHVYLETKSAIVYHSGKPSSILGIARDITKRKQMEDDLRRSEERYRTIINNIEDGYYEVDTEGNMTFCNPAAAEMLGYRQDELIGLNNQQYMNHENAQKVFSTFNNVFRTGQPTKAFDWELIRRDGEKLIVETSVSLIRDIEEKPVGFRGIFRDITERKQAEEALTESEEKFRTIFDRASDGILIADAQTMKFLQGNATICSMLGYTKKEIENLTIHDVHPPKDISHVLDEFGKMIKGEKALAEGLPVLRKDGSIFYADISSTSAAIAGKHHLVGIFRDTTERKQAEEAVRESEERYRTLVENASDIVFRLDDTGHINFVNPAALRIMGYEEKEMIGRHYPTFIRSDMQVDAMKFFGRQFVKRIPNTYSEYPVIVKDGREIWLGQNTQLICQDDKVVAFQAVARDITERKRIGEALQDSENRYRELSIVDDLTQLYNSRHFYHHLKMEMDRADRYGQSLTLLLLDLDNFKAFNDAYGHVEGDQVLWRLGQVVKRCLRETDFAFRYGGEEFTILLPMTTSADGAVIAERIRTEFKKETFSPGSGQDVHLTVSIGLAQYKPQEEMKAFVHRVDQLMYQGKKNGKDRVCSGP